MQPPLGYVTPRIAAGVLLVAVAACGSGDGDTTRTVGDAAPKPAAEGSWATQTLDARPGADQPTQLATHGERVVIAMADEDGVLTGFSTDRNGRFQAGEPTETGLDFLQLGGLARSDGGWIALGSEGTGNDREPTFDLHAFRSPAGRMWSEIEVTGLEGPASVSGVTAADGAVVAVGSLRAEGDAPPGGFRPGAWRSQDGQSWERVTLPTQEDTEGSVHDVVVTRDGLLAAGELADRGVLWSSTDAGASWTVREPSGAGPLYSISDLAAQNGTVVARATPSGEAGDDADRQLVLRSVDGGDRWAMTEDGRLIVLRAAKAGTEVLSWPAGPVLPTEAERAVSTADVDLLGEDEAPEPGERYGVPLSIHCGMDWLYVGGEPWQRTDGGPSVEAGAGERVPGDWPVAGQTIYGFATLVAEDRIEYSIGDGEVIATYQPATRRPSGCA